MGLHGSILLVYSLNNLQPKQLHFNLLLGLGLGAGGGLEFFVFVF